MDDELHPALLPVGLRDLLPPDAWVEEHLIRRLLGVFDHEGYERVKPPLIEFETSLLAGPGAAMASETFRLMDPASQRMIGLRADMTPQVSRIASTRLARAPRPLRLSYAGPVLRVGGSELQPERQFAQVGAELIGPDSARADAEIVILTAYALIESGVRDLSIDLSTPRLVPALLRDAGLDERAESALRAALDHKDIVAVGSLGGARSGVLSELIAAAGPAETALAALRRLKLPDEAVAETARVGEIVSLVRNAWPDLALTIDPVENRGFEYHTGISFTLFARGARGELGRGGRYRSGSAPYDEPATGVTLYTDMLLHAIEPPALPRRVYLPLGTDERAGAVLRADGWVTVRAIDDADPATEARRLQCGHLFEAGRVRAV